MINSVSFLNNKVQEYKNEFCNDETFRAKVAIVALIALGFSTMAGVSPIILGMAGSLAFPTIGGHEFITDKEHRVAVKRFGLVLICLSAVTAGLPRTILGIGAGVLTFFIPMTNPGGGRQLRERFNRESNFRDNIIKVIGLGVIGAYTVTGLSPTLIALTGLVAYCYLAARTCDRHIGIISFNSQYNATG